MNNSRSFWVTGASNGLGLALLQGLLDQGHRVAASGKDAPAFEALGERYGQQFLQVPWQLHDAQQAADACQLIARHWHSLDGVIINAGTSDYLPGDVADSELIEAIVTSNQLAGKHCLTAVTPLLAKGDSPQVMAIFNRYSALQLYAPSQVTAGWNHLPQWVREQRDALKALGISLTVVGPQSLKTPVTPAQAFPEQWTPQSAAQELLRRWPAAEPELVLETLDLSGLWPLPPR
ncbi:MULTISPECIES: SDR family NAD(P)-dependent oxidoreductase [Pseudomonas]|uniref:SDR family NAD(P)-dependent oxidoreductase n=1 Tax=Pseudomonas TaxID=286 RepID=UPI000534FC9F|nr:MULTISPECIES: SDR family NAD(P)-dependent oxidoreductase [Pseudomonas]EGB99206.2 short-chain dehydrogenase [Pseudomonas sp. TJI-51]MBA6120382.1 SDR family NAD(P)-dependent oxidoreductase [Pseudomonas juntendi]MBI6913174.1 SDR family NAD(P)-dependent oxidoreductase [Pseudomonas juntendi]MCF3156233.1 SDR family NAD(P)-dependent oxidoreductase [Pseudomonas juntendi]MCQ1992301.1 SDR family NAD(P)-dependent oxidoreductase [Pseudomonas sp. Eb3]